jgi:hypothetical protein
MENNANSQDVTVQMTSVALREYRRGHGISLDVDPRIDLTKPIYEQAAKLASEDEQQRDAQDVTAA